MPYIFYCSIGKEAPPYIIIASSIAQIIAIVAIIKQYRDSGVDIDRVPFGVDFITPAHYIKTLMASTFLVLILSLINVIFCVPFFTKDYIELAIKIFLGISSFSFFFGMFEFYIRFKEELKASRI